MSRRPPQPGASAPDRTEANRATLKSLVKLDANKSCADCKRNKHPRWASWNLGVFVCIRCSGIHRGMGTHISRVKSVDLDSWTDEQTQSMLRWGNARANRYWESKLAEGHVPNESKIENFIRTKYDSRRWVMDGPMPEPESLGGDDEDDDVPLNVVREKVVGERERSVSLRNGSGGLARPPGVTSPPPAQRVRPQDVDLFGDPGPARPSTTEPAGKGVPAPQKAPAAPPKQTRPGESLLGLDFLGGSQSAPPARPSSTGAGTPGVPGRADLKSSILSLYASKPAPPPQAQVQPQQPQSNMNMFGGMQSPPATSPTAQSSFGGMNDAFSSLSFSSPPQQQAQPKPTPFSNFSPPAGHASKSSLSGGSFFDAKPTPAPPKPAPQTRKESFGDFGDFSSAVVSPPATTTTFQSASKPAAPAPAPAPAATSSMGDLFSMDSPPMASKPPPTSPPPISSANFSAFNLSQQPPPVPPKQSSPPQTQTSSTLNSFASMNTADPWGSNDAWASSDPPAPAPAPVQTASSSTATAFSRPTPVAQQTPFDGGWGDSTAAATPAAPATTSAGGFSVQGDEEFGGWSHASPIAQTPGAKQSGGGFGGSTGGGDDLFGNVWQ